MDKIVFKIRKAEDQNPKFGETNFSKIWRNPHPYTSVGLPAKNALSNHHQRIDPLSSQWRAVSPLVTRRFLDPEVGVHPP